MIDLAGKLNKALKFGRSGTKTGDLRHEHEASILDASTKLLAKSETGQDLLRYAQENGLAIHVLRGADKFGFFPEKSTVYISCPGGQTLPTTRAVIHLAGALREAMLEGSEGLKRPHPRIGKERFVRTQVERRKDVALWQTAVVHEIHESTGLLEIIDEFGRMGYSSLLEAHRLDMAEKTSS